MKRAALIAAIVAVTPWNGLAAQDISTSGPNYGTVSTWERSSDSDRWGQSFTVPTQSRLMSFSFDMQNSGTGASTFYGQIIKYTGITFTGYMWNSDYTMETIWTSSLRTAQGAAGNAWRETFNTGGLELEAGAVYVALLDTDVLNAYFGTYYNPGSYTGGSLFRMYRNNDYYPDHTYFYDYASSYDAAFTADFEPSVATPPSGTVTPEPVTMTLIGTGLAGIAAARRRRKHATS